MRILNEHHSFTGMQRDMSISKHPTSFLYNAKNIRLTPRGDDTMFAITNEKGTLEIDMAVSGTYLGHCLLNNYLVVFTRVASPEAGNPHDYITRIDLGAQPSSGVNPKVLYSGELGFSTDYPIEAIASYENDQVQKVYWTDGHVPPRMINIVGSILARTTGNEDAADSQFDFIRNLKLQETVKVKKIIGGNGAFPAGVIQYAFTYYQKHGQESNIFYTSPLLYVSPYDRGGKADEVVDNSFQINITDIDQSFDYLRIYSIQRTSLDGKPICKRVQDIAINPTGNSPISSTTFVDVGTSGDSIDPTELLFKGGESVVAKTIEQKDGTLFLGNLTVARDNINPSISDNITIIDNERRKFYPEKVVAGNYPYNSQLTALNASKDMTVPCAGFKRGDYYRLGVQFQYKTGKWSDPIFITDTRALGTPSIDTEDSGATPVVNVPVFKGSIPSSDAAALINSGYKKARAVVVYPSVLDRVTICQGVSDKTLRTYRGSNNTCQPSWFLRPYITNDMSNSLADGTVTPFSEVDELVTTKGIEAAPSYIREAELQGHFNSLQQNETGGFQIVGNIASFHSPDVKFEDYFQYLSFQDVKYRIEGKVYFSHTLSDITIQTETPTISSAARGFTRKSFDKNYSYGIVAGPFYEDDLVDDTGGNLERFVNQKSPVRWMVYPWQRNGSLNNDIERPTGKGVRSAVLKKKVISNLRYALTSYNDVESLHDFDVPPQLHTGEETNLLKIGDIIYQGNIDTMVSPDKADGLYFSFDDDNDTKTIFTENITTYFDTAVQWKTYSNKVNEGDHAGIWRWKDSTWEFREACSGDNGYPALAVGKYQIRMKYKTTPHLVLQSNERYSNNSEDNRYYLTYAEATNTYKSVLPILEVVRKGDKATHSSRPYYRATMFGGTSDDAKKANLWIPCGEPVSLGDGSSPVTYEYSYGDTYFQRWECLKTYPFTDEDINQIIEIGSFMLETHVNIDGRCDRNRGQLTNVSPRNFNLMNSVYSQLNNFFTYRILDSSYYALNKYSNQITWTKEKIGGSDVDPWTNITLASTYDIDGSKGEIVSLNAWKDRLFCFQNKGVSNILFNSRVQIPTSDNVPIEIGNSYKVDGYRYLSDGIGCDNKLLIKETPSGIYFVDKVSNNLYHIGEGIQDITATHGMTSWFKNNANSIRRLLYDEINHDLYLVRDSDSLCYSEVLGQFTSFFDYSDIPLIESYSNRIFTLHNNKLYGMFEGEYSDFFPVGTTHHYQPWEFTFVANGSDSSTQDFDKVFSNIDYRMDVFDASNNTYLADDTLTAIRVTNEYQDTGEVSLSRLKNVSYSKSYHHKDANLQKKFKIWRIQIPRDNTRKLDRIRNPWCKITLKSTVTGNKKSVLQDLNVQYYI